MPIDNDTGVITPPVTIAEVEEAITHLRACGLGDDAKHKRIDELLWLRQLMVER